MDISYRVANRNDFEGINELFIEMLESVDPTGTHEGYPSDGLDRFFAGNEDWICVAEDETCLTGFLSIEVHCEDTDFLYLDDLSVSARYRNNGIGTRMIGAAEQYARALGIRRIDLHVEKTNRSAFRLYERLGFHMYRDEGHRYRMRKTL